MTIRLYGTRYCSYCVAARHLLRQRRLAFEDISLDLDSRLRQQIRERSGRYTVPQIWIGDTHIGGYNELLAWDHAGRLQALVAENGQSTADKLLQATFLPTT